MTKKKRTLEKRKRTLAKIKPMIEPKRTESKLTGMTKTKELRRFWRNALNAFANPSFEGDLANTHISLTRTSANGLRLLLMMTYNGKRKSSAAMIASVYLIARFVLFNFITHPPLSLKQGRER